MNLQRKAPIDTAAVNNGRVEVFPTLGRRSLSFAARLLRGTMNTAELVVEGSLAFDNWEELHANAAGQAARLNSSQMMAAGFDCSRYEWVRVRVSTAGGGPAGTDTLDVLLKLR